MRRLGLKLKEEIFTVWTAPAILVVQDLQLRTLFQIINIIMCTTVMVPTTALIAAEMFSRLLADGLLKAKDHSQTITPAMPHTSTLHLLAHRFHRS